uniref:Uncharacterized protein n=1 Tax=Manihot esculenta TaxID=3983 RepID=A0A2C9VGQ7_MANES
MQAICESSSKEALILDFSLMFSPLDPRYCCFRACFWFLTFELTI